MATLADLARNHTSLDRDDVAHLQRLVGDWGMLADFCFADLLLYVPTADGRWLVIAQVRPVTSQTIYQSDWVGAWANDTERPLLAKVWATGEAAEAEVDVEGLPERTRMHALPVRRDGRLVSVLTREWSPRVGRQPGELERHYVAIFERFARMIANGHFPYPKEIGASTAVPRVGDGVMVVDDHARVQFASPNAVSALHRVGINANPQGHRLAELGFDDGAVRTSFELHEPVIEEVEQTPEVTLVTRCLPVLSSSGEVTGGVLLVRDVSELRRRDRLLLSKDATIREIHHRVKNNLQTISSLLRLQGRRLHSDEAKAAVAESVRRIRTIALVHETLSREAGDDVAFVEIVRPICRMAEESLQSPDRPVRFRVVGDGGKLPAAVATPLAVVLTELLQNAVDHAFPNHDGGTVAVLLEASPERQLSVTIVDDGVGLPAGFSLDTTTGLGLSIVRTLVTTELAGTIDLGEPVADDLAEGGIEQRPGRPGTAVVVKVPTDPEAR